MKMGRKTSKNRIFRFLPTTPLVFVKNASFEALKKG